MEKFKDIQLSEFQICKIHNEFFRPQILQEHLIIPESLKLSPGSHTVYFGQKTTHPEQVLNFLSKDWETLWNVPNMPDFSILTNAMNPLIVNVPMPPFIFTIQDWHHSISSVKASSGIGPDNWSITELRSLSESHIQLYLDIWNHQLQNKLPWKDSYLD